jgi:kumamolisin
VTEASPARRTVVLSGTAAAFRQAFNVDLQQYSHPGGAYRGRTGPVHVPASLDGIVVGVFGLDDRAQATPHFRAAAAAAAGAGSFTPVDVANLYDFPAGLDGRSQTIAILELGGGYKVADLKAYFGRLGIAEPSIAAVSVDGGHNQPTGSAGGPDGEVMLDIEVAGAVAPKARIVVYFAPNTDRGFLDALTSAVHDNVRKPSVVSISWGGPEVSWTTQAMLAFDQAAQAAAALGVTICAAAGDGGSDDGVGDGKPHVDFPASSPYILACGGTRLTPAARPSRWDGLGDGPGGATGGGFGRQFAPPVWQAGVKVPAGQTRPRCTRRGRRCDPHPGYQVQVDSHTMVFGRPSAVAPLRSG